MKSETEIHAVEQAAPVSEAGEIAHSFLKRSVVLAVIDLVLACGCYFAAWMARTFLNIPFTDSLLPQERWNAVSHPWVALAVTQVVFPYVLGLFDDIRRIRYREIVTLTFAACLLQIITVAFIFFMTNQAYPRSVILIFGGLNFLSVCAWRAYVKAEVGKIETRVLVVGEDYDSVEGIIQEIESSPWMRLRIVGVVLHSGVGPPDMKYPLLGEIEEIREIVSRYSIKEIIFASRESWKDRFLNSLSRLQASTAVRVAIIPSPFEMVIGRLRHVNIHDTPLIELSRNPNEPLERFLKRSFDLAGAAVGLVVLLPVILLVAVIIKLTSPGPVFYMQERVGFGGRLFKVIKFRTMIDGAEDQSGEIFAAENDPRVTSVGRFLRRFRIDEIPQLWNVLRGEMSFVGPRPERPKFVKAFLEEVPGYNERHKVKPGITGLAQVKGFYETTAEKKLKYDLAYIYNYSFSLDLLILIQTVKAVLRRKGR
ncbi:MAG TPA: sugar transferase [Acidobacteriota bacterium]|nr:sugar transferase [Acidobacteriota bacterium]